MVMSNFDDNTLPEQQTIIGALISAISNRNSLEEIQASLSEVLKKFSESQRNDFFSSYIRGKAVISPVLGMLAHIVCEDAVRNASSQEKRVEEIASQPKVVIADEERKSILDTISSETNNIADTLLSNSAFVATIFAENDNHPNAAAAGTVQVLQQKLQRALRDLAEIMQETQELQQLRPLQPLQQLGQVEQQEQVPNLQQLGRLQRSLQELEQLGQLDHLETLDQLLPQLQHSQQELQQLLQQLQKKLQQAQQVLAEQTLPQPQLQELLQPLQMQIKPQLLAQLEPQLQGQDELRKQLETMRIMEVAPELIQLHQIQSLAADDLIPEQLWQEIEPEMVRLSEHPPLQLSLHALSEAQKELSSALFGTAENLRTVEMQQMEVSGQTPDMGGRGEELREKIQDFLEQLPLVKEQLQTSLQQLAPAINVDNSNLVFSSSPIRVAMLAEIAIHPKADTAVIDAILKDNVGSLKGIGLEIVLAAVLNNPKVILTTAHLAKIAELGNTSPAIIDAVITRIHAGNLTEAEGISKDDVLHTVINRDASTTAHLSTIATHQDVSLTVSNAIVTRVLAGNLLETGGISADHVRLTALDNIKAFTSAHTPSSDNLSATFDEHKAVCIGLGGDDFTYTVTRAKLGDRIWGRGFKPEGANDVYFTNIKGSKVDKSKVIDITKIDFAEVEKRCMRPEGGFGPTLSSKCLSFTVKEDAKAQSKPPRQRADRKPSLLTDPQKVADNTQQKGGKGNKR